MAARADVASVNAGEGGWAPKRKGIATMEGLRGSLKEQLQEKRTQGAVEAKDTPVRLPPQPHQAGGSANEQPAGAKGERATPADKSHIRHGHLLVLLQLQHFHNKVVHKTPSFIAKTTCLARGPMHLPNVGTVHATGKRVCARHLFAPRVCRLR